MQVPTHRPCVRRALYSPFCNTVVLRSPPRSIPTHLPSATNPAIVAVAAQSNGKVRHRNVVVLGRRDSSRKGARRSLWVMIYLHLTVPLRRPRRGHATPWGSQWSESGKSRAEVCAQSVAVMVRTGGGIKLCSGDVQASWTQVREPAERSRGSRPTLA